MYTPSRTGWNRKGKVHPRSHHYHYHHHPSLLQRGFITHRAVYKNFKYPEIYTSIANHGVSSLKPFTLKFHFTSLPISFCFIYSSYQSRRIQTCWERDPVPSSSEPSSQSPWTYHYAHSKRQYSPTSQKKCIFNTAVKISNLALEEPIQWSNPMCDFLHLLLLLNTCYSLKGYRPSTDFYTTNSNTKKSYFMGTKSYSRNYECQMVYTWCFWKAIPRHGVGIPVLPEGSKHGWEMVNRHFNNWTVLQQVLSHVTPLHFQHKLELGGHTVWNS